MMQESERLADATRLERLVSRIEQARGVIHRLPRTERLIADRALRGDDVHMIAQQARVSEAFVWEMLESLARTIAGAQPDRAREIAGMGADLDPGVTGGYGDTAFGAVGAEPPIPVTEEEEEESREWPSSEQ